MHRIIRDQANKTLDIYLQRIRKHASTMPDTALPPTSTADTTKDAARIGTSNDKSWAGWAISSFTNKITTANGEIEPTSNGSKPAEPEISRSASVPRPVKSSPSTQETLRPTAVPLNRSLSDRPAPPPKEPEEEVADDVYDAWGAIDDDDEDEQKDDDPFASPAPSTSSITRIAPKPKVAPVPFDDGGEPDFAGWLAAQSQAKAKKALPKGLNKSSSTATSASRTSATTASKPKTVVAPAKKIDTKPKEEEADDGWDAWD
jgi:SCY1-like protein 1